MTAFDPRLLALAVVVPQHEISLVGGVMQAFEAVFDALGVGWLLAASGADHDRRGRT